MFFNNFLPSNIGGDVVRIADTAPAAGSKTLATTVILVDRVLGLTALVIVAASGALVASLLGVHDARRAMVMDGFGARSGRRDFCNRDAAIGGSRAVAGARAEQPVADRAGATARRCGHYASEMRPSRWLARSPARWSCRSQLWPFIC